MPDLQVKSFWHFLTPNAVRKYSTHTTWEPLTSKTIINRQKLEEELVKIKAQGYGISHGEWLSEASGIAAPIFDQNGEVIAALAISGPTQRFSSEKIAQYIPEVTNVASLISHADGLPEFLIRLYFIHIYLFD